LVRDGSADRSQHFALLRDVRGDACRGLSGDCLEGLLRRALAAVTEDPQAKDGQKEDRDDAARGDQRSEQQGDAAPRHRTISHSGSVSSASYGPSLGFTILTSTTAICSRVHTKAPGGSSRRAAWAALQSPASTARSTAGFEYPMRLYGAPVRHTRASALGGHRSGRAVTRSKSRFLTRDTASSGTSWETSPARSARTRRDASASRSNGPQLTTRKGRPAGGPGSSPPLPSAHSPPSYARSRTRCEPRMRSSCNRSDRGNSGLKRMESVLRPVPRMICSDGTPLKNSSQRDSTSTIRFVSPLSVCAKASRGVS